MDYQTIKHKIQKNEISHIYLFTGPESGDKKEILSLLKSKIFGESDPVVYTFYCDNDFSPADFSDTMKTQGLFAESKLVILKGVENASASILSVLNSLLIPHAIDAALFGKYFTNNKKIGDQINAFYTLQDDRYLIGKIKEADKKKIVELFVQAGFSAIPPDTYFVMMNETSAVVPEALSRLAAESQTAIFYEMFDNKKVEWIRAEFKKYELYADNDAVSFLLDTIENNKSELEREILNISVSFKEYLKTTNEKAVVTRDFIEDFLYHSKEETPFTLFNAMIARDLDKSLMILDKLFSVDREGILAGLLWSQRRLVRMIDLYENMRMQPHEIFKEMFITRKKMIQELEPVFSSFTFTQAVYGLRELAMLEYYLRVLPPDLKLVKLQEFIVRYISGNSDRSFLQGELLFVQH